MFSGKHSLSRGKRVDLLGNVRVPTSIGEHTDGHVQIHFLIPMNQLIDMCCRQTDKIRVQEQKRVVLGQGHAIIQCCRLALVLWQFDDANREQLGFISRSIIRAIVHDDDVINQLASNDRTQDGTDSPSLIVGGYHHRDSHLINW